MTITTDPLVRDPAAAARGSWLMLIVLLAGQFMAPLDVTIVAGVPLARTVAAARRPLDGR
jgi:hypothetical protein